LPMNKPGVRPLSVDKPVARGRREIRKRKPNDVLGRLGSGGARPLGVKQAKIASFFAPVGQQANR